ncbi:MAG TPA: hypothetical protein VKY19_30075 [Ktedonosporobacter sp.]|nr:hypothetical protein [Ktedonosporobacter sp.]
MLADQPAPGRPSGPHHLPLPRSPWRPDLSRPIHRRAATCNRANPPPRRDPIYRVQFIACPPIDH